MHPGETDPIARALESDPIRALAPAPGAAGRAGTFRATLDGRDATLTLALNTAPIALRRPLAFSRLAAALGFHVVPVTVARAISAGELGALLSDQPAALELVRREARVQNDGTVDALLAASPLHPRSLEVDPRGSYEVQRWERTAASPTAEGGESPALTRDFVEMLVLDYLAAFALRRSVVYLPDAGALLLEDNLEAFPSHPDPASLLPLLRRIRDVARFPRGLRDALVGLDRDRAAALFAPAGFETWLLAPRSLIELDERRKSLLTLLEAQIAQRGAAAVLCL